MRRSVCGLIVAIGLCTAANAQDASVWTGAKPPPGYVAPAEPFQDRCVIEIPPGAIPDSEPGFCPSVDDTTNGGCNDTPNVFGQMVFGKYIAGTSGTALKGGQNFRDTDWYKFYAPVAGAYRFVVSAEFTTQLFVLRETCPALSLFNTSIAACGTSVWTVNIATPGVYNFLVAPTSFSGVPCGSKYYFIAEMPEPPITYQGVLKVAGAAYTGTADLEFRLFDAPTGGSQLEATITKPATPVVAGTFSVDLSPLTTSLLGNERYIEISARTPAGSGAFNTILPRTRLSSAPSARWAARLSPDAAVDWSQLVNVPASVSGAFSPWTPDSTNIIFTGGRVGIGTAGPVAALDVRGNIALGNSSELRAVGGTENLRTLRGSIVGGTGSIGVGTGFTAVRNSVGNYTITYSTPFMGTPTVVATAFDASALQVATVSASSSTGFSVRIWNASSAAVDSDFSFVVMGTR